MNLISVKLPEKRSDAIANDKEVSCEAPVYPYGLKLRFENDIVSRIPQLDSYTLQNTDADEVSD